MEKLVAWLSGKKTYIVMVIMFILGGLQAIGIGVPEWVYAMLVAVGLGAVRAGVTKSGPTE